MLLLWRALIGIARRNRDAIDAHGLDRIKECGNLFRLRIVKQGAIDIDAETARFRKPDCRDSAVIHALLAYRAVMHLLIAVEVHRPDKERARLVLIELLFH